MPNSTFVHVGTWWVAMSGSVALAQAPTTEVVRVTSDNFIRAETDLNFAGIVKKNGFGRFAINRELTSLDKQNIIRLNRDTLNAVAVFDLDASPVTITLPDPGKRFMSMQVLSQDHYTHDVIYEPGSYTFTRSEIGTRYVLLGVRILVDPAKDEDIKKVHALQDAITVDQRTPGKFEVPNWDPATQKKVRDSLLALAETLPDMNRAFGRTEEVDPVRHMIGTAAAWGGNPEKDATYLHVVSTMNDGDTVHRLIVEDVPVDGFWSISVYNAKGYYEPNALDAYNINSVTSEKREDGSVAVQFGGCAAGVRNCIPIMQGWNYMVRLYRPRPEILSGQWKFPEARPAP